MNDFSDLKTIKTQAVTVSTTKHDTIKFYFRNHGWAAFGMSKYLRTTFDDPVFFELAYSEQAQALVVSFAKERLNKNYRKISKTNFWSRICLVPSDTVKALQIKDSYYKFLIKSFEKEKKLIIFIK